jgi:chemotaxis protein CheX
MTTNKHLDIFISGTANTLKTMAATEVIAGEPYVKDHRRAFGVVTGLIGLASSKVHASMTISFEKAAILGIVSAMFHEEFTTWSDDVLDAVGEFTNIICGEVKKKLSERDISIEMASPLVVSGAAVKIRDKVTSAPMWAIPFETKFGKFVVETNLPG